MVGLLTLHNYSDGFESRPSDATIVSACQRPAIQNIFSEGVTAGNSVTRSAISLSSVVQAHFDDDHLLTAAVEASFAALVTLDRSLPHQQETQAYPLGVIVLDVHPATPAHLKTHMDRVQQAVPRAASKQSVIVLE